MHLLVLSAFRPESTCSGTLTVTVSMHLLVLSAFRRLLPSQKLWDSVSMHLLVLSAFRRSASLPAGPGVPGSQCTFWCSVLSDKSRRIEP